MAALTPNSTRHPQQVPSGYRGGCGQGSKACRGEYTARGDRAAIKELVTDFRETLALVREHHNVVLLSEAQAIADAQNLRAMEEWVCRAQKLYGVPQARD